MFLERCTTINIRTERWGNEISYAIGRCVSQQWYGSVRNYQEECCLAPGKYTLDCNDSWGDGWNGGYLEIDGNRYCDSFYGHKESVDVEWSAA